VYSNQVASLSHNAPGGIVTDRKNPLVQIDIIMPRCDGLTANRLIKSEMPEVKIVALTTSTEDDDLFEAIKSGACGYLPKSIDTDELIEALNQVQQGTPAFSPGLAAKLLDEFKRSGISKETISPKSSEKRPSLRPGAT
jgi:two-component system NarL family response regulator